jgi:hypothetical protein
MIVRVLIAVAVVAAIMIVWAVILRRVIRHHNSGDMAEGTKEF